MKTAVPKPQNAGLQEAFYFASALSHPTYFPQSLSEETQVHPCRERLSWESGDTGSSPTL